VMLLMPLIRPVLLILQDNGKQDDRPISGLPAEEWSGVYRENLFRIQSGSPVRTHYKVNMVLEESRWRGSGPKMPDPRKIDLLFRALRKY